MSPVLKHASLPWSLCRLRLSRLFVAFAIALAGVVEGCRFGHNSLLECGVLGIDYFFLAALLREGCVVVMRVMMLVLWLQRRVNLV
jgi:hypothetical protein